MSAEERKKRRGTGTDAKLQARNGVETAGMTPGAEDRPNGRTFRSSVVKLILNMLFYLIIAVLLTGAVALRSAMGSAPVKVAGYSGMVVLSGSMRDVIPEGSLIITKWVEPKTIRIGDDVSYMADSDFCVTHRVIGIRTMDDGTLAFRTQGVNNPQPDSKIVKEASIIGKVVYHNLAAGRIVVWIKTNWPLVVLAGAVMTVVGDAAACGRSLRASKRKQH